MFCVNSECAKDLREVRYTLIDDYCPVTSVFNQESLYFTHQILCKYITLTPVTFLFDIVTWIAT